MKNTKLKVIGSLVVVAGLVTSLTACSLEDDTCETQKEQSEQKFEGRTPPDVTGDAEYENYIRAQEDVYDDPNTILWCTAFPSSSTAPIITVPIAGKLTSSSVSYYPSQSAKAYSGGSYGLLQENQSVDGMYHGTPGPYRYGFTPGGQYFDFTNVETICTTQLTEFQKTTLQVSTVAPEDTLTQQAEDKLAAGDDQGAQELLDSIGK